MIRISSIFLLSQQNDSHVSTADVVGKFCLSPAEINSSGLSSLKRSMTTSFGSICQGSFIVGFVGIMYNIVYSVRFCSFGLFDSRTDPLLNYLESLSRWAYVSMGVHGSRFPEGGTHAMAVFHSRGYTTIIPDMADTLLFMLAVSVGFLSALYFAMMVAFNWDARDRDSLIVALVLVPFFVGTMLAMTFFSMIGVAVKTVTLCYLESSEDFQKNHPQLYDLMNDSWHRAYPGHIEQ